MIRTAFILMAGVIVASCNKRPIEDTKGKKIPVLFSSNVAKTNNPAGNQNKVTGVGFDIDDVIGIFAYHSTGSMFAVDELTRFNVPYLQKEKSELLTNDEPIYFPEEEQARLNFVGYYPYSSQMTPQGIVTGNIADQSQGTAQAILYSDNAKDMARTANYVALEFHYVMAQVIVNIKYDPVTMPGGDPSKISAVMLSGSGLYTAFDFDATNGSVQPKVAPGAGIAGSISMRPGLVTTVATVLPGAVTGLRLDIVTPIHTYSPVPKDITYEAGYQYTYNVTLRGGGDVEISSTIVAWEPGNGTGEVIPGESAN